MSRLNQYIPLVVEDNEWLKMQDGSINQVQDAPTHDEELIFGNQVLNVPKGKGGIGIQGVEKVLSATHENRNPKDSSYTYRDEEIKILPNEVENISKALNLKTSKQNKGISPSKLFSILLEAKNKQLSKYDNIKYGDTIQAKNAALANEAVINTIPSDEDLFEAIFNIQESKKSYEEDLFQYGGRLQIYPTMYGNRPAALVNTPQGVKTVDTINNRTVSMDDLFVDKDSVIINGRNATIIPKKSKLIKKK